jgi:hypothetical protein
MSIRNKIVDFSDWSGGKNSAFPIHSLAENEVVDTVNLIHEKIGGSRAPGYKGVSVAALFDKPITGHFTYRTSTGVEHTIVVSNGKVWSVDTSAGTKTERGTMAGGGQAYAVNLAGKLWIVNGTSFVKVESDLSVYDVQLPIPSGNSAAAVAGGTLADGVYGVYVSYARKDSSDRYLYSYPESLGNVTLGTGNNTVEITVAAPTDGQVTHVVAWLTDAGGAVPYYYGEADEDAGSITIADNSDRNASIRMDVNASSNADLPIAPSGIYAFGDRLIVWATDTVYWSMKTDINPFDLERFLSENFRTFAFTVSSVFNVDTDLFFNSSKTGIHRLPFGDMTAEIKRINQRFWFNECLTEEGKSWVSFHNNLAFGYTNDGIRFFNGQAFSDDLTFKIKPDINSVNLGVSSTYKPAMAVYRREGKRTELRFSYRDLNVSNTLNNRQLVLNLDFFFDPMGPKRCWEVWEVGFCSYSLKGDSIYCAQTKGDTGVIASEFGVADESIYNSSGTFLTSRTAKQVYLYSGSRINRLDQETVWGTLYALATANGTITGNYVMFDKGMAKSEFTLTGHPTTLAILPADGNGGLVMPIVLQATTPTGTVYPMPFDAKSSAIAIELSSTADDVDFRIYNLQIPRAKEIENNLT